MQCTKPILAKLQCIEQKKLFFARFVWKPVKVIFSFEDLSKIKTRNQNRKGYLRTNMSSYFGLIDERINNSEKRTTCSLPSNREKLINL